MNTANLADAERLYRAGDTVAASDVLERILAEDPANPPALALKGCVMHDARRYDDAVAAFDAALRLAPAMTWIHVPRGNALAARGDTAAAEASYEAALAADAPNISEAHAELGKLRQERWLFAAAARQYDAAVATAPRFDGSTAIRAAEMFRCADSASELSLAIERYLPRVPADDRFLRNALLNESETARRQLHVDTYPRSMTISLTNRCNLDCIMCEAKTIAWELPDSVLAEIVSFFPYLEHVMWQGGEVFLHKDFPAILREARRWPRMKQVITSNGMALTPALAEDLASLPDLTLTLSVDSVRPAEFERIRKGARFGRLLDAIAVLKEARRRAGSRMKLNINVTVMKSNCDQLAEIVAFAGREGFDFVFLTTITGNADSEENIFLRDDRQALRLLAESIPAVERTAREQGILLHNWLPVGHQEPSRPDTTAGPVCAPARAERCGVPCAAPWQRVYIDWHGNVFPDCICLPEQPVGNVRDMPLREIWNGQRMQDYRAAVGAGTHASICKPDCLSGRIGRRYLLLNR